ncbi:MRPS9 [Candida oxycetoniae]|uniref:Small ribosomal subunit protein uS9m n=1 Tax=Candida oxycetoniae TaxID=497107 RepID=A0AAI9SUI4_9ASCO|nr:MRPS9 [Candida oxycetoniae]KAI3402938.2 MRPS9 [Candida oxycetoniae]
MVSGLVCRLNGLSLRSLRFLSRSAFCCNETILSSATTVTTDSATATFDEQVPRRLNLDDLSNNKYNNGNNDSRAYQRYSYSAPRQVTENLSIPEINRIRIIPTLMTFYGGNPIHEENMNRAKYLLRKYQNLPTSQLTSEELSSKKFIGFESYKERTQSGTRVRKNHYRELITYLNKLRTIDDQLMPQEVIEFLNGYYSTSANKMSTKKKFKELDEFGRSHTKAKRKASRARAYLVRGEGNVIVNGKNLVEYFPNVYSRKNIAYPFQVVDQEGKYNVFAEVSGGGYTGQSEALMYAIAKGLVVFNPLLKPRLSKAGLMTSDSRVVERKKPGKLKSRKSPTWVKR